MLFGTNFLERRMTPGYRVILHRTTTYSVTLTSFQKAT